MKNADYFSNYVTEDFTTYINRKRKNNCHGNHIEMQAMAEMYNRPVEVYQDGTGEFLQRLLINCLIKWCSDVFFPSRKLQWIFPFVF